tara:strand:+ start:4744 stop:5550 length:807 start_codon:yes stop_codon:yes gene_type:complete
VKKEHYQAVKSSAQSMNHWVFNHLLKLNIFECAYGKLNMGEGSFVPIPMYHQWYASYKEQNLDLTLVTRLHKLGINYWKTKSYLLNQYHGCLSHGHNKIFKLDIIKKVHDGYEMLVLGSYKPLAFKDYQFIYQVFHEISHQAEQLRQEKPALITELRCAQEVRALHQEQSLQAVQQEQALEARFTEADKFKCGNLILEHYEMHLIKQLLSLMTYEEIAAFHQVSVDRIVQRIRHIKQKVSDPQMSDFELFKALKTHKILMAQITDFIL